jgi:hypothetical protein
MNRKLVKNMIYGVNSTDFILVMEEGKLSIDPSVFLSIFAFIVGNSPRNACTIGEFLGIYLLLDDKSP